MQTRGERTRLRLLDAGAEVFARKGYHATRVDDIVQVAQTSHGTFYLYFTSKDDLFAQLATAIGTELEALTATLDDLGPGDAGRAALEAWIDGFTDFYERSGPVIRAWTEAESRSHELGRLGTETLAAFTAALTDRITTVVPRDLDPATASLAIVAMLERLHYYVAAGQVRVDRARMVRTLARVTYAALFGPPAPNGARGRARAKSESSDRRQPRGQSSRRLPRS